MNLASAEKAIRHGAVAGFIFAGFTLTVVSIAVLGQGTGYFEFWDDPTNVVDVVLIGGLSLGILKRSRAAAISLVAFFILAEIHMFTELGRPSGSGIASAVVFLYFFGRAVLGTFAYHRIRREQDPEYRPVRRWMYFVWVPVGLLGVVMTGGLVLIIIGPPTAVVAGDDLSQSDLEFLRAEGIVEPNEQIILFYSAGLFSIREDGNLITNRRVISYEELENQIWIGSPSFDEIKTVSIVEPGSFFVDTIVLITLVGGESFHLYLSTEKDGDKRFLDELNKRMM